MLNGNRQINYKTKKLGEIVSVWCQRWRRLCDYKTNCGRH